MKLSLAFLLLLAVAGFTGCSNQDATTTETPMPAPLMSPPADASSQLQAGASGALNPPHGEPGHRCDIAVGAPLNSQPQPQGAAPAVNMFQDGQQPAAAPAQTVPAPSQPVAAGTNPPHGQPGHDCAIPVGAPLNQ